MEFSFLCTFVAGSEKSTDGTFVSVELSFPRTFAPVEQKVQELSLHGTFALILKRMGESITAICLYRRILAMVVGLSPTNHHLLKRLAV